MLRLLTCEEKSDEEQSDDSHFLDPLVQRAAAKAKSLEADLNLAEQEQSASPTHFIPRGTLQATLTYQNFDYCRRIGLPDRAEKEVIEAVDGRNLGPSFPNSGMLAVDHVMIQGASDESGVVVGDILYRINGEIVTDFYTYEAILDECVGMDVEVEFFRGKDSKVVVQEDGNVIVENIFKTTIRVRDFRDFALTSFVEVAGAILHQIPYGYARKQNLPLTKGIYCVKLGFVLGGNSTLSPASVLYKINDIELNDLDSFV